MATISPTITINSTPGLQISTDVPAMSYNALVASLGAICFDIDTLYYGSQSYNQLSQPVTYNHYSDQGNAKGFVISIPINPGQFQPAYYVPLQTRGVIIDAQSSIGLTMLANSQIRFIFYGKTTNIAHALDSGPGLDSFKEIEKSLNKGEFFEQHDQEKQQGGQELNFVADDMPAEELKQVLSAIPLIPAIRKQTFIINLTNNTSGNIPISLFNQGDSMVSSIFNATTRYAWDITGASFANPNISLLSYPVGSSDASTLSTGSLQQANAQGLINLLNSLNIGVFWLETSGPNTFVVTWNNNFVYGGLTIGVATTVVNWSNTHSPLAASLVLNVNAVNVVNVITPPNVSGFFNVNNGDIVDGGMGLATVKTLLITRTLLAPPFTVEIIQSITAPAFTFILPFTIDTNYSYNVSVV